MDEDHITAFQGLEDAHNTCLAVTLFKPENRKCQLYNICFLQHHLHFRLLLGKTLGITL